MVVPVERVSNSEKTRKYVGNDLKLSIVSNKRMLIITGNNCKVKLHENTGLVKVIGDSCEISILKGNANIEYIGNNGKIKLGSGISEEDIIYIGNGGEIATSNNCSHADIKKTSKKKHIHFHTDNTKNLKDNLINISNSSKVRCSRSIMITDTKSHSPNI